MPLWPKKERRLIAERTKAALSAKKAAGASFGNPHNLDHAGSLGRAALVRAADEFASSLVPVVNAIPPRAVQRADAGLNGDRAEQAWYPVGSWRGMACIFGG